MPASQWNCRPAARLQLAAAINQLLALLSQKINQRKQNDVKISFLGWATIKSASWTLSQIFILDFEKCLNCQMEEIGGVIKLWWWGKFPVIWACSFESLFPCFWAVMQPYLFIDVKWFSNNDSFWLIALWIGLCFLFATLEVNFSLRLFSLPLWWTLSIDRMMQILNQNNFFPIFALFIICYNVVF